MNFASLVLLSYKRPEFLKRTIESLHENTLYPYELIVVDDGSRDASWPYLMELLDQRLVSTVIFNGGGNMGVGVGVNRGFSIARGDYLVKLDSDLEFKKGWLSKGIRTLETFSEVWCLGWFHYFHDPCDHRKTYLETLTRGGLSVEIHRDFVGSAILVRTSMYQKYGPWLEGREPFDGDVFFRRELKEDGGLIGLTPKDWIHNYGFGIPHSSVVRADMTVTPISKLPQVFGGKE